MIHEYADNHAMAKKEARLVCPDCAVRVDWDGAQYVCPSCSWTEHRENPPSSSRIEVPKAIRNRKPKL
jgi:hypothetical protein